MSQYCSICPLVRGRDRIPPSGPSPCRLLFIAERPAREEDKQGIPLADRGKTGIEFNDSYLPIAGLFRENVAVYNAVCCSDSGYKNPTPDQAAVCSTKHLPDLLHRLNPQIIVTMGAVSASLFSNISLTLHHGIPQPGIYADWSGIVFPTFHPSAGLHSTSYMIPLRADFAALKTLLKQLDTGTFEWPTDPYPITDYQVLRTVHDFSAYVRPETGIPGNHFYNIGTDTEFSHHGPHCLTFSHTPGTARLIYADNTTVLKAYASFLQHFRPLLHFHSYLADVNPYASMGIHIDPRRFSDTMIQAYNLGIGGGGDDEDSGAARGSLGLKVLAHRHLHMRMKSFDDLATTHVFPLMYDYLNQTIELLKSGYITDSEPICTCNHPQSLHQERGKTKRHTGPCYADSHETACPCMKFTRRLTPKPDRLTSAFIRKLSTLSTKVLDHMLGLPAKTNKKVNPWETIKGWYEWEKDILGMVGEVPVKDVRLIPEVDLVPYACQDSDATLRLARFLDTYQG